MAFTVEPLLAAVLSATPRPVVALDPDLRVLLWNDAATDLFGWSRDEVLDRPMPCLPEGEHPACAEVLGPVFEGGSVDGAPADARTRTGRPVAVSISARPLLDGDEVVAVVLHMDEVSEHAQMVEALRRSERRFRTLFERGADAIFVHHPDGRIVDVNEAACTELGYTREELLRTHLSEVVVGPTPPGRKAVQHLRDGERMAGVEARHRRKDGTTYPVDVHVSGIETEEGRLLMASTRDRTARYEAERSLRRSNEILNALIDSSPVGIIMSDAERLVARWNPAAERILGWKASDVLGRPNPAIPEGGRSVYEQALARVQEGETVSGLEVTRLRKDGRTTRLVVWTAPLRDDEGNVTGSMAMFDDITERSELESQLRQSQKMEAVGQLAGGVAHDFNNHLTTIISLASLVQEELEEGSDAYEDLAEILRAARHSAELTEQLLTFSRTRDTTPELLDLSDALGDVRSMLERVLPATIELEVDTTPAPCPVRLDPAQLQQLVLNLAINARDAMPRGGRLTIGSHLVRTPDGTGDSPRLVVSDDGRGMSREVRERIFEPFFTTKGVGEGTGLGLATVYAIVEAAGGRIEVRSAPGKGTAFEITFPRAETPSVAPGAAPADAAAPPGNGSLAHVLLVEDDAAVRRLARTVLQAEGFSVQTARDGDEALDMVRRADAPPALLLCDVILPRCGGLDVVRALEAEGFRMPVLLMTGYTSEYLDTTDAPASVRGVIRKPFGPGELVRRVFELVYGERPAPSSPMP